MWRVLIADKRGKTFVGWLDFALDRSQDGRFQTLLIGGRNTRREVSHRLEERTGFATLVGRVLGLGSNFFHQETRRHEMVLHALPHVRGYLVESFWNLVEARNVIFVVVDIVERRQAEQFQEAEVQAIHLLGWHFPGLELSALDCFPQISDHRLAAERLLCSTARGVSGYELREKLLLGFPVRLKKLRRTIGQTVVVA